MQNIFGADSARKSRLLGMLVTVLVVSTIIILISCGLQHMNSPHTKFPTAVDITINEGLTQRDITKLLKEKNIVRSSLFLDVLLHYYFKNLFIQSGTYHFDTPHSTYKVAESITHGLNRSPLITVTFPEGFRSRDIYNFLPLDFKQVHVENLNHYDGQLFPDTYFISNNTDTEDLIELLQTTFTEKLSPYMERIKASSFSKDEVIILASIIEREAKDLKSKHMVSGILQNRLAITMPLQVDATFDYILNKASHELTDDDLRVDSPYNMYIHTGLPPTPIANPGLESIEAVLTPIETKNLYYLTSLDGTFYYAETFEEHKRNKVRYLR